MGVMLSLRFRLTAEGDWFSLSSSQNPLRAETKKHSINFKTNPGGEIGHWPPFVRLAPCRGENPSKKSRLNCSGTPPRSPPSPVRTDRKHGEAGLPLGSSALVLSFKRSCRSSIILVAWRYEAYLRELRHFLIRIDR